MRRFLARASLPCLLLAAAGCFGRTDLLPRADKSLGIDARLDEVKRPAPPDEPPPAVALGPGDVLDVEVAGVPGSRERCPIGADGMVYYGPLDGLVARGRTLDDLAKQLEPAMAVWYKDPHAAVVPVSLVSREAMVLGRVNRPGAIPLTGGERIIDLIAEAGGLSHGMSTSQSEEVADLSGALYVRGDTILPIDFIGLTQGTRMDHNIRVHPGDYLYVPSGRSREIDVFGAVGAPQAVAFREGLTVARVIARAGGFTRDSYLDRVVLVRGSTSSPRAGLIDVKGIIEGRKPDVRLEPRDIVYVPGRTSENPRLLFDLGTRAYTSSISSRWANQVYTDYIQSRGERVLP